MHSYTPWLVIDTHRFTFHTDAQLYTLVSYRHIDSHSTQMHSYTPWLVIDKHRFTFHTDAQLGSVTFRLVRFCLVTFRLVQVRLITFCLDNILPI